MLLVLFVSFAYCQVPAADITALENLYNSLNGGDWTSSANWLTGDPCSDAWHGITCTGSVIENIDLASNNVFGIIPSSFSISTLLTL